MRFSISFGRDRECECCRRPAIMADSHKFRTGEKVRVYSLQSFDGGGFIDGACGTVRQDQIGGSVLVTLPGRENSYEVYPEQLRIIV